MSFNHSKRVWATDLKGGKLLVMLALAQHADDKGECWPGAGTLAAMARVSDRQVRRVLNELEKSGHIVIEERAIGRGKKPHYRLFPVQKADKLSDLKAEEMSDQTQKADKMSTNKDKSGQNVHNSNEKADISDTKSGHFDTGKADIFDDSQSHARSGTPIGTPLEEKEEEDTRTRDPIHAAWFELYGEEMPEHIEVHVTELLAKCPVEAVIHGIQQSVKAKKRTFGFIEKCALNYIPPAPTNGHSNDYQVHLVEPEVDFMPGIHPMQPDPDAPPPPRLPPPMPNDDPWAICLAELAREKQGSITTSWLEGSHLEPSGELAGVPLYRVMVTNPSASAEYLTTQLEASIRRKLGSIFGKPILLEFIVLEMEPT